MLNAVAKEMADNVKSLLKSAVTALEEKFFARIDEVNKRIDDFPVPRDGKDVTPEEMRPMVLDAVKEAVDAIERPKDGHTPTEEEILKLVETVFAKSMVEFERRASETMQRTIEREIDRMPKPKDGLDGKDALDLENFELSLAEDGRTVSVELVRGDERISKSVKIPSMLYRGVYKDGSEYECGDAITYGGSLFISVKDAPQGRPESSTDWKLAVKRGRDGAEVVRVSKDPEPVKIGAK